MKRPLLVVAGPTGVGKTAMAVALARRIPLEVISADSRQVYRGMDVATGKPTPQERLAVPHHLVDVVNPDERYHAARFRAEAARLIEEIAGRGRLPVVVGGTGFYIRALLRGLDPAPPADLELRRALESEAARLGRPSLWARLDREAPAVARRLHPNDTVRIIRALERLHGAGGVATELVRWRQTRAADYDAVWIGLTMDRVALRRRLGARAAAMVAAGLAHEVRGLLARGYDADLPSMQGLGYREFVQVVGGTLDEAEALRRMQRDTMRYAKRQWTWFAREPDVQWLDVELAGGPEGAAELVERRLRQGGLIG
ncbi:MAG TPA: tRNA (adenosine(37)-N6)-dimethylallyltransferase MiaA [Methylomirabilota bacterium]|nr:tRNA (adenosine(37)-N6)-dimethylallyltransferase MiaA [Methylomirabilota bacterium]